MGVKLVHARESDNCVGYQKLNTLRQAVTFHCIFFYFLSAKTSIKDHILIDGFYCFDKRGLRG